MGRLIALGMLWGALASAQHLVLCGSSVLPTSLAHRFVKLSGETQARIVFVPWAAPSDPAGYFAHFNRQLHSIGYTKAQMIEPVEPDQSAISASVLTALSTATGIFFGGGDQNRLSDIFQEHPALADVIHDRYNQGFPVGGASAGMMMAARSMLTGETTAEMIGPGLTELGIGLGLTQKFLLDSHFLERKRQNRLLSALLDSKEEFAIGVDAGGGAIIENDRLIYAYSDVKTYASIFKRVGPDDFQVKLLKDGQSLDLATW